MGAEARKVTTVRTARVHSMVGGKDPVRGKIRAAVRLRKLLLLLWFAWQVGRWTTLVRIPNKIHISEGL